ncbi:unnamed protein product [Calypogeia fissa]
MLRVRASAFLAGFAMASAVAMYQLQKEVWASHRTLSNQAKVYHSELESRINKLEKSSSVQLQSNESAESS